MGRKIAVTVNAVWALVIALRLVMSRGSSGKSSREIFAVSQVASLFGDLLRVSFRIPIAASCIVSAPSLTGFSLDWSFRLQ